MRWPAGRSRWMPGWSSYRELLTDKSLDPALVAHILTLPGEAILSELAEIIEVEAIHRAPVCPPRTGAAAAA